MKFKNIIFDLGGVILDIDYNLTIKAFKDLGIENAETLYSKVSQVKLFDELEKGNISEKDFYSAMREIAQAALSDDQIRKAWNAILIDLPVENVNLLEKLKLNHRLFLLSNTNIIHEKAYKEMITKKYGSFVFDELFEKMYLSHHIHMRKPDKKIFNFVIQDARLNPEETIFIDDSPQHVEAGIKAGITSYYLKNMKLVEFFKETEDFRRLNV
jgi:HAD superfamily hydrolase (TIGR01509 family)